MPEAALKQSDKSYWHRYTDIYARATAALTDVRAVLEFGVFKGDSIRWLSRRFPNAHIVGADILPVQPSWPDGHNIEYVTVDQESSEQIRRLLGRIDRRFDLVIEDGSHHPAHQRNCLIETLPWMRSGGVYILEDIHTSHPGHPRFLSLGRGIHIGALHVLLAIEHLLSIGAPLDTDTLRQLSTNSLFSRADVERLFAAVAGVQIFKRATLPDRCYQCGRPDQFDYASLRCRCGALLYESTDSMTAILRIA